MRVKAEGVSIIGIAGSARAHGNTDQLLTSALSAAAEHGARVDRVAVRELQVTPCRTCDACFSTGLCVVDSVADRVHERIATADAVILATPVYFGGVPSHLKALIDRAQARHWAWVQAGAPPPDRPALVLVAGGRGKMKSALAGVRTVAASWLAVLGFAVWEIRGYPCLDAPDDVSSRHDILAEVAGLGRKLVQSATQRRQTH